MVTLEMAQLQGEPLFRILLSSAVRKQDHEFKNAGRQGGNVESPGRGAGKKFWPVQASLES